MSVKPIVDTIRIRPRTQEYLERNYASSGEIYFNKTTSSLKVFNGIDQGGMDLARSDLANVSNETLLEKLEQAGFESGNTSIAVSESPPNSPSIGQLWFDTNSGILYVYYQDSDSQQWVQPSTGVIGSENLTSLNFFNTVQVSGQSSVVASESNDALTIVAGSNINISTNAENKIITISAVAGESGIASNSFTTIIVPGQTSIVADNETDSLVFASGNGISISTNSITNTLTITNTSLAQQLTNFSNLTDSSAAGLTVDKIYLPAITRLTVSNVGASAYTFDQYGQTSNPIIYAISGTTIAFSLEISGHPFLIQDGTGANFSTGLIHVSDSGIISTGTSAQGKTSGTLYWKIPSSISGTYRYQCSVHTPMVGAISIKNIAII